MLHRNTSLEKINLYNRLFKDYYVNLSRFAYTYVKDFDVSEEIVQEVFLNLWQKADLPISTTIRSFLYVSVKNRALNFLRDQKTRLNHENAFAMELNQQFSTIESDLEHNQLEKSIQKAVTDLPEKCRQIFELSRTENLTYQQIAERLDISPKTVENQMSIAIKKLKTKLSPFMNILSSFF